MNIRTKLGIGCLACVATVGMVWAQGDKPTEPSEHVKLDFVVKELEGSKVVNARAYSTTISTDRGQTSIRTGSRVPTPAKDGAYSYLEVGVNFDCRAARAMGAEFALNVSADISSLAEPPTTPPVIRTNRWSGDVLVPLRKPTVIFSSDDVTSKRQMQVELTATPVK